jgi:hypothetical protein
VKTLEEAKAQPGNCGSEAEAAATADVTLAAQSVPEAFEWVVVPRRLTPEMRAAMTGWHGLDHAWRMALEASPSPPGLCTNGRDHVPEPNGAIGHNPFVCRRCGVELPD